MPACIIEKGLPDASLVADIMQRKYQLGEPLYRQEKYWEFQGIYLKPHFNGKLDHQGCGMV